MAAVSIAAWWRSRAYPVRIFNGFFMPMASKFTQPGTEISYYSVEWDLTALAWEDFRGKVLEPTDPAVAPEDCLLGQIAEWRDLGLKAEPDVGENSVHALASPSKGFAERSNWLVVAVEKVSSAG